MQMTGGNWAIISKKQIHHSDDDRVGFRSSLLGCVNPGWDTAWIFPIIVSSFLLYRFVFAHNQFLSSFGRKADMFSHACPPCCTLKRYVCVVPAAVSDSNLFRPPFCDRQHEQPNSLGLLMLSLSFFRKKRPAHREGEPAGCQKVIILPKFAPPLNPLPKGRGKKVGCCRTLPRPPAECF